MADEGQCTLQSQDGRDFTVDIGVAKMSATIKNLIEDAGISTALPLPNVTGKILAKVVDYCEHHAANPAPAAPDGGEAKVAPAEAISPWDADFTRVDQATLFEMILAANYLDIKDLLDLTCKVVANMIRGKTPEQIRATFNIVNDFTKEEEEQGKLL